MSNFISLFIGQMITYPFYASKRDLRRNLNAFDITGIPQRILVAGDIQRFSHYHTLAERQI